MKILTTGHKYELPGFENPDNTQTIQFIEKKPINKELITLNDGVTNESILEMLINRMNYLQAKFPCQENENSINCLNESLYWLHMRTADREKRNVEGKHIK